MKRILHHRPSPGTAFGLAALVIAIGGAAFAAIPDSGGTIHGCYDRRGTLRVIDTEGSPPQSCRSRENALNWNQQGPPGPPQEPGVRRIGPLFLSQGESDTILQAGALTFTAQCGASLNGQRAEIVLSTSEDNSLFTSEGGNVADYDIDRGETPVVRRVDEGVGTSKSQFLSYQFNAQAPGGTSVSGVLALGVEVLEHSDQCAFAGHVSI